MLKLHLDYSLYVSHLQDYGYPFQNLINLVFIT